MRAPVLILLVALAGCSTVRQGLGEYQKAADKGFEVKVGDAPLTPTEEVAKAPVLPGGLGGDKANAAYTSPPPQD
ncbi:hypothetical protein [Glacieibacterium frigidum]|uniref:Lipoprotein n=1 Tax=Glacieibacterium frigidum TaxID=2593303 RepID=A0A552U8K3_9SPHN|nr:hypothetical protein [Glacieibacterium frigidum]TRW14546.1 hypothetical protein FMM06_12660 [Glacieibacterium frigidum]